MIKQWIETIVGTLPPAFLVLVTINLAFLGVVLWFLDSQLEARTVLLGRIIDRCLAK